MTRIITLLLISLGVLLGLVTAELIPIRCTNGKVYDRCGSSCPPTCDNLDPTCPEKCVPGCFCTNGTVDNGLDECVEMDKCKLCSGNKTYSECANNCPGMIHPVRCKIACIKGCGCKANYGFLPDKETCVLAQDFPKNGSSK